MRINCIPETQHRWAGQGWNLIQGKLFYGVGQRNRAVVVKVQDQQQGACSPLGDFTQVVAVSSNLTASPQHDQVIMFIAHISIA